MLMPPWVPALIAAFITIIGAFVALKGLVGEIRIQMMFMQAILEDLKKELDHFRAWRVEVVGEIAGHEVRLKVMEKRDE